jgi:uncharacterized protein (DUF433 family)
MALDLQATPVPLREWDDGTIRVGDTRVLLEIVVHAYLDGWSAEEIVAQYDSLELPDVYAVLAYYLRHRSEVDEYVRQAEHETEKFWAQTEARHSQAGLRELLLARLDKS